MGPYDIASVMDESVSAEPLHIKGPVIDMFDPLLPVLQEKIINPGQQSLLYDLKRIKEKNMPQVLCALHQECMMKREARIVIHLSQKAHQTPTTLCVFFACKTIIG